MKPKFLTENMGSEKDKKGICGKRIWFHFLFLAMHSHRHFSVVHLSVIHFLYEMNRLLTLTAVIEAATGLTLMAVPAVVVRLLLGSEISGAGIPLGPRRRFWPALAGSGVLAPRRTGRKTAARPGGDAGLQFAGDALSPRPW